jgi:hypothetical protein
MQDDLGLRLEPGNRRCWRSASVTSWNLLGSKRPAAWPIADVFDSAFEFEVCCQSSLSLPRRARTAVQNSSLLSVRLIDP